MTRKLTLVIGHRCQLLAAKFFRRAIIEKADLKVLYGGGTHQVDLAATYFGSLPYMRPDFCLGLHQQMTPVEAVEQGIREIRELVTQPTGWLLWGSGPEVGAALISARLRQEPVMWWDESEFGPNVNRDLIRGLMGLLPGTYENLPRPFKTMVPWFASQNKEVVEGGGILLALSEHHLWRLHVDETVKLLEALVTTGMTVSLLAPGNPGLMEQLPASIKPIQTVSLGQMFSVVDQATVVLTDRLDASVIAGGLGKSQLFVGVGLKGLIQGEKGTGLTDLGEFCGQLITQITKGAATVENPEDSAIRWVRELSFFLETLP